MTDQLLNYSQSQDPSKTIKPIDKDRLSNIYSATYPNILSYTIKNLFVSKRPTMGNKISKRIL